MSARAPSRDAVGRAHVRGQARLSNLTWWYGYGVSLLFAVVVGALAAGSADALYAPSALLVLAGVAVCLARPVWGVYLTVALAVLGDASLFPRYPITKNFSSSESLLYISDELTLSPLDLFIVSLLVGWVLQMLATRSWHLYRGPLFAPLAAMTAFVFVGLVWGVVRSGSALVAYWEVRPLLYVPALFLLVTNLLDQRRQYRALLWTVVVVVTINAIGALWEYQSLTMLEREALESLGEHGAAVHWSAVIVFALATLLFRHRGMSGQWILLLFSIPVAWALLLSERRAGMVALFAGLALVLLVLSWHHRLRFGFVFPLVVVVAAVWLVAFWNSTGPLALPADAVKAVFVPGQQNTKDQASDFYRTIEEFNIISTIRANPVMGVGFGQPYYVIVPMPDISFFPFWQYITHNSILWVWMKAGVGGFVAMFVVFAMALRNGARAVRESTDGAWTVVTTTSVAYVMMFAVFAYVDIAWDTRNVVLLAVSLAQIDRAATMARDERTIDRPVEPTPSALEPAR